MKSPCQLIGFLSINQIGNSYHFWPPNRPAWQRMIAMEVRSSIIVVADSIHLNNRIFEFDLLGFRLESYKVRLSVDAWTPAGFHSQRRFTGSMVRSVVES